MCFQPGQFFETALWDEFCLENKFKDFSEDNFDADPHGRAHDLEIMFILAKEKTFQRFRAEVIRRFGQFDAEEQFERLEIRRGDDLIAIRPLAQITLDDLR